MSEKDTYWQKHIDVYLTSGLTQKAFCKQNNIVVDRFKYHYRRLHLKSVKIKPSRGKKQNELTLAPVSIIPDVSKKTRPSPTSGLCTIHLPNGTYINLHDAQLVDRYLSQSIRLC